MTTDQIIPTWLLEKTFVLEYSPNCPSKYMVRLCGKYPAIDKGSDRSTNDAVGCGNTVEDAAKIALAESERLKQYRYPMKNMAGVAS